MTQKNDGTVKVRKGLGSKDVLVTHQLNSFDFHFNYKEGKIFDTATEGPAEFFVYFYNYKDWEPIGVRIDFGILNMTNEKQQYKVRLYNYNTGEEFWSYDMEETGFELSHRYTWSGSVYISKDDFNFGQYLGIQVTKGKIGTANTDDNFNGFFRYSVNWIVKAEDVVNYLKTGDLE